MSLPLPRNEYTRVSAREAGRLRARASECGGTRLVVNGKRQEWVIDDSFGYLDRVELAEHEAYRWRSAWWCSENAGVRIRDGEMTAKALAMQALWLAALPSAVAGIGGGVLAVMWMGAMVLR